MAGQKIKRAVSHNRLRTKAYVEQSSLRRWNKPQERSIAPVEDVYLAFFHFVDDAICNRPLWLVAR
jgi:hypothetical protein